ncbi:hypothetical protein B0H66DRAFT_167833 [Apodospora peruviana]|uniref:Uncharacterized protein n=1 Tax=Apodospora peruviana TaxID=516989 RepID=A0AAE0MCI4_9PEZI|nr:hypothetical protein B0H66DRAFT_167833 [Apodospora peruviana]
MVASSSWSSPSAGRGEDSVTPRGSGVRGWTLVVSPSAIVPPPSPRGQNRHPTSSKNKTVLVDSDASDRASRLVLLPRNNTNRISMTPGNREIVLENMRLYQRIAAMQRKEKSLHKINQDLATYMASLKQEDDACQRAWEEEVRDMELAFEAKLKELEQIAAQQKKRLKEMAAALDKKRLEKMAAAQQKKPAPKPAPSPPPLSASPSAPPTAPLPSLPLSPPPRYEDPALVTDSDIEAWLTTRGSSWFEWADDYAHRDGSDRITKLDMIQQHELCRRIKSFVHLTEDGKLPPELLARRGRINTAQILLDGMLAHFVVKEAFVSPLWVFAALSVNRAELVSPDSSPVSPFSRVPPGSPSSSSMPGLTCLSYEEGLPSMRDMGKLQDLFVRAQQDHGGAEVHTWRTQLMRILTDGGLSHDPNNLPTSKNMRRLVRARREYARKLKEEFLSGPARLLLQDQDAAGIERLEWRLVNELDMALRLSAQLWSSQSSSPRMRGLGDLKAGSTYPFSTHTGGGTMMIDLCQAQQMEFTVRGYDDRRSIIAVLRPEIRARGIGDFDTIAHSSAGLDKRVWTNAQVFVSPRSVVAAAPPRGSTRSRPTSSEESRAGTTGHG